MNFKYFIILIASVSLISCQKENSDIYSKECAKCTTYEEEFSLIQYAYDPINMDFMPYDTVAIIAVLDSGTYCIGDQAFAIDFADNFSNFITIGNDTIEFDSNQNSSPTVFLETIDEDLLNLMTQNGSCEFAVETGNNEN